MSQTGRIQKLSTGRQYRMGLSICITLMVVGCATTTPPSPPQTISMRCAQPTFSPLPETTELQEKGGLRISVAPHNYTCRERYRTSAREVSDPLSRATLGLLRSAPSETARYVRITETPYLAVSPDSLKFTVKINNQLPRVFRGSGIVVQFNVGGKLQAVDQSGYAELANIIVPPRTEAQVEITGPRLESIPEQTTLGLFLYDAVTQTDAAGNVTEKQNFEWYFNYVVQNQESMGTVRQREDWVEP